MASEEKSLNFIEQIIEEDLKSGLSNSKLRFRFPPEPNGYLHIGHASSIALNFGLGIDYQSPVNLRFDDTNPEKEEQEFVDAIKKDVEWLGYNWTEERYASDYFQQLYDWAVLLIKKIRLILIVNLLKIWLFKKELHRPKVLIVRLEIVLLKKI